AVKAIVDALNAAQTAFNNEKTAADNEFRAATTNLRPGGELAAVTMTSGSVLYYEKLGESPYGTGQADAKALAAAMKQKQNRIVSAATVYYGALGSAWSQLEGL